MTESPYRTSGGVPLTDEAIQRLADEAEAGYDLNRLGVTEDRLVQTLTEMGRAVLSAQCRLDRIAEAHTDTADEHGGLSGYCPECRLISPCPTLIWATSDRSSLDPWDPDDDEKDKDSQP